MITTKSLIIARPALAPGFVSVSVDWLNDPEVVKYSEQRHKIHSIETQLEYLKQFNHSKNRYLGIRDAAGDRFIGTITVFIDDANAVADVGIMIGDKNSWRKGYGYEAWKAVCDDLLYNCGIRKIEAGCMFANKPMTRIFKKYEMFFEGCRRNHFQFDGSTTDMVLYGKFA